MWYLTVSATVFCYWLGLFMADKSTPKTHIASWLILLIAPLFWPIVIPASIVELLTKSASEMPSIASAQQPTESFY